METVSASFDETGVRIRSFRKESDLYQVTELERRCETGSSVTISLYADLLGDPLCRVRRFSSFTMLVAEVDSKRIVGLARAGIKDVVCGKEVSEKNELIGKAHQETLVYARVGYIVGLRVCPFHRRAGIGLRLAYATEEWCKDQGAEFVYMATEKSNMASIELFTGKLGYKKLRNPRILVHPVFLHREQLPPSVRVTKLARRDASTLYKSAMGDIEFFPKDIDDILKDNLYEGTWVATMKHDQKELEVVGTAEDYSSSSIGSEFVQNLLKGVTSSWAMLSIWKFNEIIKFQVAGVSKRIRVLAAITRFLDQTLPCLKIHSFPDVFSPFGMQFMFGIHAEGIDGHMLLHSLCRHAHNIARKHNCQVIMTELSSSDPLVDSVPHWKLFSADDLWCMKKLKLKAIDEYVKISDSNHDSFSWHKPAAKEGKTFFDPRDV